MPLILQASAREAGSKAYVAFLDVKKAFDTVWHAGLLVKHHQKRVTGHLWRLINSWYTSSSSCVLWNGTRSSSFVLKQGVSQGGTLSRFYMFFLWMSCWTTSRHISGIYCGTPMYADDLALVTSSPSDLQAMLNMVHKYAQNGTTNLMRRKVSSWYSMRPLSQGDESGSQGDGLWARPPLKRWMRSTTSGSSVQSQPPLLLEPMREPLPAEEHLLP